MRHWSSGPAVNRAVGPFAVEELAVNLVHRHIPAGSSCDIDADDLIVDGRPVLLVVRGGGRGCELRIDGGVTGMWVPLRGRLQINGHGDIALLPGQACVTEAAPKQRIVGKGNAIWTAVLGQPAAWLHVQGRRFDAEAMLLPAVHRVDRIFRRNALALARSVSTGPLQPAFERVLDDVHSLQLSFRAAIARCPGRTYAQRIQVFLRLQRVRNYLAAHCYLDIDNDLLARMANYSRFHFIRAFGTVYEETPYAFLINVRLERARQLLRESPLAIGEVALASGFGNRHAFARLFRQRFGTSATAMRRASRVAHGLRPAE